MTDLEDLWNSLPTGQPPTSRILQQGRLRSRRWRVARRPMVSIGALAALGGAFIAGTLVSGPPQLPGGGTTPDRAAPSPVSFQADLASAASCDELLASYVDRALGQVTAWGWESYGYHGYGGAFAGNGAWLEASTDLSGRRLAQHRGIVPTGGVQLQKGLSTDRVTASESGTNVQEEQVDEPDSVKSDGSLLVRLRENELLTYDVSGRTVRELSALRLRGFEGGEILLSGMTVVVIGTDRQSARSEQTGLRRGTRVQTVSLEDPSAPEVTDDVTYGAAATSTRQHGDVVRMVLSTGLPDLAFDHPRKRLTAKAALVRNRNIVMRSRLSDWLPGYAAGGGRQDLLDCENVAVPPATVGLDTTAVVTFAAGAADNPRAFGLAGATSIAYESADHLYLASTPSLGWGCFSCRTAQGGSRGTSHLFQFDLADDRAEHVASGEVEGTLRDRWSLDEVGGQLRVLVGPSSETGNFNSVVTFRRRGAKLVEDGRLDRLGPGEEIKSVRWQDDLAIVVTFRETDPLYVIDLREQPRVLSKLRVPGFSSYLHPLGPRRLIGVGSGPGPRGWGAQLGLFAVQDLRSVSRLDVWSYGRGSDAYAAYDPRAFTWLPEHRTVLTVIQKGRTGWLSIQRLAAGRLHNRMVRVEYGDDIAEVRTIGLPGGKVVLVTGEDIRFLKIQVPVRGR